MSTAQASQTLHHLGISGGKDSTGLLLWAVHESGIPKDTLRVSFCDTGNEAEETYDHIRMLSETVFPVEWIYPSLDFYQLAAMKKRFPGAKSRFCTKILKIDPTGKHIKHLMEDGSDVVALSGVRASESIERAALPEREWSDLWDCEVWRPLLRWTLQDVWGIHKRYDVPRNKLYDMGCQRVGCLPCIMSRKEEIFVLSRQFPERIDRIREAEQATAHDERGGSSFFPADKIPPRYRSRVWVSPEKPAPKHPKTTKPTDAERQADAEQPRLMQVAKTLPGPTPKKSFAIAMIDDVVRWAEEEHGVRQIDIDFEELDEVISCNSKWGACE